MLELIKINNNYYLILLRNHSLIYKEVELMYYKNNKLIHTIRNG